MAIPFIPLTLDLPYCYKFFFYLHYLLTLIILGWTTIYLLIVFLPKDFPSPLPTRWTWEVTCCSMVVPPPSTPQVWQRGQYLQPNFLHPFLLFAQLVSPFEVPPFPSSPMGPQYPPLPLFLGGVIMVSSHINCMSILSSFKTSFN